MNSKDDGELQSKLETSAKADNTMVNRWHVASNNPLYSISEQSAVVPTSRPISWLHVRRQNANFFQLIKSSAVRTILLHKYKCT